jgi:hypothetical protein
MQNHNYSLSDLDNQMPWEREIYITMLVQEMKEKREEQQRQAMRG